MKNLKRGLCSIILFISLTFLYSCASTTLTSVWKDDNYRIGNIHKILIIVFSEKPAVRRFFEDQFKSQMAPFAIDAVSSYTVIPDENLWKEDVLAVRAEDLGIDAVLMTQLVDKKTVQSYVQPETTDMDPSSYSVGWPAHHYSYPRNTAMQGYTVENDVLSLETNLYDAKTNRLIWSAFSSTITEGAKDEYIKSFISVIMKRLSDDKIL